MPGFWWSRIRAFVRSKTFTTLFILVVLISLYSVGVNYLEDKFFAREFDFASSVTAFFGATLSLLMVFRTNGAYDRWWEGRKVWGALVNECRNLAVKSRALSTAPAAEMEEMRDWIVAFPFALKNHLRDEGDTEERRKHGVPSQIVHSPGFVARRIFEKLSLWRKAGHLDDFAFLALDKQAKTLLDICGACERIKKTPLPLSHRALIPQVLIVYLLVIPWGMPSHLGSVALVAFLSYFLLGLELVAEGLEQPFDDGDDDLPLNALCQGIEESVRELSAEEL